MGVGWAPAPSLPPPTPSSLPACYKGNTVFDLELTASWDQAGCVHVVGRGRLEGCPGCCQGLVMETQMAMCVDGQMDKQMTEKENTAWEKHPGTRAESRDTLLCSVLEV